MRIKDKTKTDSFTVLLEKFDADNYSLHGINDDQRKAVLIAQLVDSTRRINFLNMKARRSKSDALHTPYSGSFDAFGGAAKLHGAGKLDDAFWLVFLATHFGKHKVDGWNLTEDVYGRLDQGKAWTWDEVRHDPNAIGEWIDKNYENLKSGDRSRRFGNHRKYETLKPGPNGTGNACLTYIEFVNSFGSHKDLIAHAHSEVGQNPKEVFAYLYAKLNQVSRMGRLGKFDLLCNLSNLLIAPIIPDRAYIELSTGPLEGAKLLFGENLSRRELDRASTELAEFLNVSPQVIEDALCNWQKSPAEYRFFRG